MNQKVLIGTLLLVLLLVGVIFAFQYAVPRSGAPELTPDEAAKNTPGKLLNLVNYACDGGKGISAAYYAGKETSVSPGQPPKPSGTVILIFKSGETMTLHQTISADGGRYTNADESFVFWSKGDGAMVLQNGAEKDYTHCTIPVATSTSTSQIPNLPSVPKP